MDIRKKITAYSRIVVKIGTSSLTYPNGRLKLEMIEKLAWILTDVRNQGKEVILVSSGAIGVGAIRLAFSERPKEIRQKQAAAAVGQAALMQIYQNFFMRYNQTVAQVLLTNENIYNEVQRTNITNTFETLLEMKVIPIVNANDTTSTLETEFDNDQLSAHVASLLKADLLIVLTDIDGLYDSDPKINQQAKRISYVSEVTDEIIHMAGTKGSEFSIGGMETKLAAAKLCADAGVDMVIANGSDPKTVTEILKGEDIGTYFQCKCVEKKGRQ